MRIIITGKNLKVTPNMTKLTEKKLGSPITKVLPKLNQEIETAGLTVKQHSRWGYVIKFNLLLPKNYHIVAKSHQKTYILALTDLKEKVEKQIKRYMEKIKSTSV
jgi:ribosomal subunit interface protein